MKAIIIEDEKPSARRLARMLQLLHVPVHHTLHSVEEAINWFQTNPHPDLIFLDIQLSDGLSFDIFKKIPIKSAVIFTTAYDEYALQAFKLNSIDYLLKPIDDDELAAAVEKYRYLTPPKQPITIDFEDIRKMLIHPAERVHKKRFTVKIGQHLKIVTTDEVECFYSDNKATYAHTSEGRNYLLDSTLDALEDELPPRLFFRVNRRFFINIQAIQDIIAYSNARLQVKLHHFKEQEIIVSRDRVKDFKDWLG